MANPTKAQFNADNETAVNSVVLGSGPMSDTELVAAFNALLARFYTVDPTKKPTVKRITDLEF